MMVALTCLIEVEEEPTTSFDDSALGSGTGSVRKRATTGFDRSKTTKESPRAAALAPLKSARVGSDEKRTRRGSGSGGSLTARDVRPEKSSIDRTILCIGTLV